MPPNEKQTAQTRALLFTNEIVFLNNACFYGIKCLYPLNLIPKGIDIVDKSEIIKGIIAAET